MPVLNITGTNGRVVTLEGARKVDRQDLQATTRAALRNGKDDVVVAVGPDTFMASGTLGRGFTPASATIDGQPAQLRGLQRQDAEPTNPWRAFKNGFSATSLQAGAAAALAGIVGSAVFFGGSVAAQAVVPLLFTVAGVGMLVGVVGASLYQGYAGSQLNLNLPDATKIVPAKINKLAGRG